MTTSTPPALSPRHLQVIAGLARGHSLAEIAADFHVSYETVKTNQQQITRITGARGAAAIVNWAYQNRRLDGLRPEPRLHAADLGPRDIDVLALVAKGLINQQIAHQLNITPDTVRTHLGRIFTELCTTSRHHAVALAWQQRLLGPTVREAAA